MGKANRLKYRWLRSGCPLSSCFVFMVHTTNNGGFLFITARAVKRVCGTSEGLSSVEPYRQGQGAEGRRVCVGYNRAVVSARVAHESMLAPWLIIETLCRLQVTVGARRGVARQHTVRQLKQRSCTAALSTRRLVTTPTTAIVKE